MSRRQLAIYTPLPTDAVLAEYEQAIKDAPEDAGLRVHYAYALKKTGNRVADMEQTKIAVQLMPQWAFAHSILANYLKEQGEYDTAILHYQEALRLLLLENVAKNKAQRRLRGRV